MQGSVSLYLKCTLLPAPVRKKYIDTCLMLLLRKRIIEYSIIFFLTWDVDGRFSTSCNSCICWSGFFFFFLSFLLVFFLFTGRFSLFSVVSLLFLFRFFSRCFCRCCSYNVFACFGLTSSGSFRVLSFRARAAIISKKWISCCIFCMCDLRRSICLCA